MENIQPVNRVEQDIQLWRHREERFEKLFPAETLKNTAFLREKLSWFEGLAAKYGKTASEEERITLQVLRHESTRIARQAYPNRWLRALRTWVLRPLQQQFQSRNAMRVITHNEQALREALIKAGFGHMEDKLAQHMKQGLATFTIPVSVYMAKEDRMDYQLSFRRQRDGTYQFNSYNASLQSAGQQKSVTAQQFPVEQNKTVTAIQAYNLLSGRAVQKEYISTEGKQQTVWMQLDFNDRDAKGSYRIREYHADYGFKLTKALEALPLKELLSVELLQKLLASLQDGSRVAVTLEKAGRPQQLFIEANPQHHSVNIYDSNGTKISLATALGRKTAEQAGKTNSAAIKSDLKASQSGKRLSLN